ncbi:MAG TPA: trypsin-like peptidase domain-containing protein [Myxococcales bacterium]|nr:trypsin-like peptidase domain-containing protein [Myxococcales bacterium]
MNSATEHGRSSLVVLGLIAVLALGGMLLLKSGREIPSVRATSAADGPAHVAMDAPKKPAQEALTVEEIARRATPSVVSLSCADNIGAGFFAAEDLVVTNAHVTCPGKNMMNVRLSDGRNVLGAVRTRDPWIDVATIEVVASNVPALHVGDPLALAPGSRVVAVGSPKGLEFSVSDGTASFVGRNLFGIGYVQFNATINPGNSGGPLLDATGAVVGIVTLKETDAEGIAFALPIWYARPPEDPGLFARWSDFLTKLKEADAVQRAAYLERISHPSLVSLQLRKDGLNAIFAQSHGEAPQPGRVELQVTQGQEQCLARGHVERWIALDEVARQLDGMPRRTQWLLRSGDAKNLYYGLAVLDLSPCRLSALPATVRFESGDPIAVPSDALLKARSLWQEAQAAAAQR